MRARICTARLRVAAALLVLGVTPVVQPALGGLAQEGYSASEFNVARRDNEQLRPRISGRFVVWQDYRNVSSGVYAEANADADVYGREIDGSEFKVTSNGTSARPAISGNRVVYTDSRDKDDPCGSAPCGLDIRGYHIANGDVFNVVERSGDQDYADIDGDLVVWQDQRGGDWDIRGRNLANDESFEVIEREGDQKRPAVSGNIIAWEDYRRSEGPDIYAKNLQTGDTARLTENNNSREPAVSGFWIAYRSGDLASDSQRIRLVNVATSEERNVTDRISISSGPRISGNLVVWSDRRNEEDDNIWLYDIARDATFRVSGADQDQTWPDVSGSTVVWEDERGDNPRDIRGARLTVPTAATPTISATMAPVVTQRPCEFVLGFRTLRDLMASVEGRDAVGTCRENEWHGDNGDGLQQTTGGLMVWRKADNWTAFTDGHWTRLNGPCGYQARLNAGPFFSWEGRPGAPCTALDMPELAIN